MPIDASAFARLARFAAAALVLGSTFSPVSAAPDPAAESVVTALGLVGVDYRSGGASGDNGFDCSGLTRYVYALSFGLVLPRSVDEQAQARGMVSVDREQLSPGDLVFFNTLARTFSHVGIYIGEHRFVHSPRSGKQVRTEDMSSAYWSSRFTGARRPHAAGASAGQVPAAAGVAIVAARRSSPLAATGAADLAAMASGR